MRTTKIEWTDKTWNPITGCTKKSAGCAHCYAEVMARRLKAMGLEKYQNGFQLALHEDDLNEPLQWKKPHNIFVCSMSDIFHEDVPFEFVDKIMNTIRQTPQHRYQILTKRAERMAKYFGTRIIPQNVWLGVTVECKATRNRIDHLRKLNATIPVHTLTRSHDRFLLLDDDVYHIGASIKDLGKRWFAIMKMQETKADDILEHL